VSRFAAIFFIRTNARTEKIRAACRSMKDGALKIYPGFPHGMLTTHADVLNPDLLAFVKS
jgi:hypothetical protein